MNDDKLSDIFLKYLPAPRAKIFEGQEIPEIISKREQDSTKAIMNVLQRSEHGLASLEKDIVKVQRKFRAKKREKENLERVPYRYRDLWQRLGASTENTKKLAKELLADANKPYHPKCEEMLAKRIMEAAKKIELFSTVSHLTAASALESIFNDGLYGRQTMIQSCMVFKNASLSSCDIREGDANVVCLGANAIDPRSRHGIELQFDAKKIAENNPCVFYKQRDLGLVQEKVRRVKIGDLDLYFSHTSQLRRPQDELSSLLLYTASGYIYGESSVIKATLIADNINEMHRILTLNFFRFIDGLTISNNAENIYDKEAIYSALSKLSNEELVETLLQIGKNMTDTMEFNFYGAYKIDFSALLTIKNDNPPYTLDLPSFVDELKAGNIEQLIEAKEKLPEIFNSYRFIDHLLSHTENKTMIAALQEQREKCTLPAWMQEASGGFKPTT